MSDPLDPDVQRALAAARLEARNVLCISNIRSADLHRFTYRIDLASGVTLKARRLEDEATAARLATIRSFLPDGFAPVTACHGNVVFEQWIDGDVVGGGLPGEGLLAEAATMLASLHTLAPADEPATRQWRSTASWREDTTRAVVELERLDRLGHEDAMRIASAMAQLDPGEARTGIIHTDFCGENMVVDREGRLRLIDNERVEVGPVALDLARTWYRWSRLRDRWAAFRAAYATGGGVSDALEHELFWRIVAVAKSAVMRARLNPARAQEPSALLRELARGLAAECR